MLVISGAEFKSEFKKFCDMAKSQRVIIKRKTDYVELVVSESIYENPSPSNDPYFADSRNLAELDRRLADLRNGREQVSVLEPENIDKFLGL